MKNVVLLALVLGLVSAPASATVLTFEGGMPASGPVPNTYGDKVTGAGPDANGHTYGMGNAWTPNVEVDYLAGEGYLAVYGPWEGDPGVAMFLDGALPDQAYIVFTPDPGFGVQINSFDLDDWSTNSHSFDWIIHQDNATGVVVDSGSHGPNGGDTTITTLGLNYMGTVVLELIHTAGTTGGYIAVDDVNFDQVVPEPATMIMLGLGVLGVNRRRK